MLLCDKKIFYVGITKDIDKRLKEHRDKKSFFTKKFSCIELAYCEKYDSKSKTTDREKQIKGWNRAKKQMLIDGKLGINTEFRKKDCT